jgi:formylglycine-generating enzyme required for sulfatase activity
MCSSESEKSWTAGHGGSVESVADESPQHEIAPRAFALGNYDVTREEYAAFVRETGYPAGDGCGRDSFKWDKEAGVTWQSPGFDQTGRDPVVCVSWQDAKVYIRWLNAKVRPFSSKQENLSSSRPDVGISWRHPCQRARYRGCALRPQPQGRAGVLTRASTPAALS